MKQPEKFRKKPVVIDAMLWTGKNLFEITTFIDGKKPNNMSCQMASD